MKTASIAFAITLTFAEACIAQEPPGEKPERAAALANARAYEAAYAKGDAKALSNFFAEDAEYTDEEGRVTIGRTKIEEALRAGLTENRGAKIAIDVETTRALSPDVMSEKGRTTVTRKNGDISQSIYTAISVRKDDKWSISELVESPVSNSTPAEHLSELAWLIGDWEDTDKTNNVSVRSQYVWARGENFITRNITVRQAESITLEGWQIIGWDPVEEQIRSWTFDGEGGFSEGYFTREGNRWLLRETGVTPDGSRAAWDNTITKASDDRIFWESNNRTLNGEPQPGIGRVEINRVKAN